MFLLTHTVQQWGSPLVSCGGPGLLSSHPEPFPRGWTLVSLWEHVMSTESTAEGKKDASQQICTVYLLKSAPRFLPWFVPATTTESPPPPALQGWAELFSDLHITKRCISYKRLQLQNVCVRRVLFRCYFLNKIARLALKSCWLVLGVGLFFPPSLLLALGYNSQVVFSLACFRS